MKLPNAPLLEVVFELRWALEGPEGLPVQLHQDPAYSLLAIEFTEIAKSYGFGTRRDMATSPTGPLGHTIHYRYFRGDSFPFPIWQIGPGIFAYNESTDYEWSSYRASLREAVRALLVSYPKSKSLKLRPVHLELRYTDAFSSELLGHTDLAKFFNGDSNLTINLNKFFKSNDFGGAVDGRLEIVRKLKNVKNTVFCLEVGTGEASKKPTILVVSKVLTKSDKMDLGSNSRSIVSNIIRWADAAHKLTHEFFWDFVSENLMKKVGK